MTDLQPLLKGELNGLHPIIIAGPCSAETEEQVMTTARDLAKNGIKISAPEYGNRAQNRADSRVSVSRDSSGSNVSRKRPGC